MVLLLGRHLPDAHLSVLEMIRSTVTEFVSRRPGRERPHTSARQLISDGRRNHNVRLLSRRLKVALAQ